MRTRWYMGLVFGFLSLGCGSESDGSDADDTQTMQPQGRTNDGAMMNSNTGSDAGQAGSTGDPGAETEEPKFGTVTLGMTTIHPMQVNCRWLSSEQRYNVSVFLNRQFDGLALWLAKPISNVAYPVTTKETFEMLLSRDVLGWAGFDGLRYGGDPYELTNKDTSQEGGFLTATMGMKPGTIQLGLSAELKNMRTGEIANLEAQLSCEGDLRR